MTESTSPRDATALAIRWRQFLRERGADANPLELVSQSRPIPTLAEARTAARRVLVPPTEGLGRTLGHLLEGWSSDWATILQDHPQWSSAGSRLQTASLLIDDRGIADAEDEIIDLLAECCPPIALALPYAMTSLRGVEADQPSPEQRRQALDRLIQWLRRMTR